MTSTADIDGEMPGNQIAKAPNWRTKRYGSSSGERPGMTNEKWDRLGMAVAVLRPQEVPLDITAALLRVPAQTVSATAINADVRPAVQRRRSQLRTSLTDVRHGKMGPFKPCLLVLADLAGFDMHCELRRIVISAEMPKSRQPYKHEGDRQQKPRPGRPPC